MKKKKLSRPEILKTVATLTEYSLPHVYNVNNGKRHNRLISNMIMDISNLNKSKSKVLQPK
jgi:hypothetical protein